MVGYLKLWRYLVASISFFAADRLLSSDDHASLDKDPVLQSSKCIKSPYKTGRQSEQFLDITPPKFQLLCLVTRLQQPRPHVATNTLKAPTQKEVAYSVTTTES